VEIHGSTLHTLYHYTCVTVSLRVPHFTSWLSVAIASCATSLYPCVQCSPPQLPRVPASHSSPPYRVKVPYPLCAAVLLGKPFRRHFTHVITVPVSLYLVWSALPAMRHHTQCMQ